jgi:spore coat protein CotF
MQYSQFISSLKNTSGYKTLEEAKKHTKETTQKQKLAEAIAKDNYQEISEHTIASIIKEYHEVKVTDTLIESYLDFASSNTFTIDPVVHKIRSLNKLDRVVEGKLHYVLTDGSTVAINEATQDNLNKLLENEKEIIEFMRESKENFFYVLEQIEE